MIYKSNTRNAQIKALKAKLGLTGDVYVINDHIMESLASHKKMFPGSTALTIEDAEKERLASIEEEKLELERLANEHAEQVEVEEVAEA